LVLRSALICAHDGGAKDITIKSIAGELHIHARKKVVIIGGGSYSEWSATGITHGTAGTWLEHAALHAQVGPMTQPLQLQDFPQPELKLEAVMGHFPSL
jgi:uncharacterized protein (DUF2345 family)